jgi:ATP-dependent exoDNAse (exonuclease V) beta subunit
VVLGRTHDAPIAAIREIEAAEIAGTVRAAVDEGWPVRDRTDPDDPLAVRPARWADVAILLPTRTSLPQLEAAFETAAIPYRVISSSLVWSTQEVRDLLNILQAIDDPTDEVALVAALRSPAFACSDDALLSFRKAGGRWDVRSRPADTIAPDHPVLVALQVVDRLRRQRWWLGISGIIDQIVRDLRLFELAFAHDRPRDRWRRLRFVLDQARTFERTPGATLRQFLAWADRQASDDARVREPSLPESDDDAVQILTVHGAKGLEFPITVVTGLNRRPDQRVATVVWNDEGRPEVGISAFRTGGYEAVAEIEKALDRQESIRLLYVATTRAQDHLILSLHRPERSKSDAEELARICAEHPDLWRSFEPVSATGVASPARRPAVADADQVIAATEQTWAERTRLLQANRRRPSSAATAINALAAAAAVRTSPQPAAPDESTGVDPRPIDSIDPSDPSAAHQPGPDDWGDEPAGRPIPNFDATDPDLADQPEPDGAVGEAIRRPLPPADPTDRHPDHQTTPDDATGGSATGAGAFDHDDKPQPRPDAPVWRRGRAGSAIGRAVHAVLQTVDLATDDEVDKTARAQASAEGVDDAAPEIARAARAALGSDVVRDAVDRPHWREVYVAAPVGVTLVEGFIDLLVDTPDGLLIVDYKTDQVRSDTDIDAAVARYRLQLATYALVLQISLGRPVARAALLFVSGGKARTRWIDDLGAAVVEVRALLDRAEAGTVEPGRA